MASTRKRKKKAGRSRLVRNADKPTPPQRQDTQAADKQRNKSSRSSAHNRPAISVCMIVKNEEELLPNCLKSIAPLADELVIVDTGSTDRTVEIAESFRAKVYHYEWRNDFSAARNVSIEYGTGDWICIIDADEELYAEDLETLRQTLYTTDADAISVSVYNYSRDEGLYTSFLPSIRIFRRETGGRYEGIVHNLLRLPDHARVLRLGVRFRHYGYGLSRERMERKVERTKSMLLQQLEENPDYAFAHFNLAQILRGEEETPSADQMDRVIYHARRAVDLAGPHTPGQRHIHLMASHQLVTAYFNKGDFTNAEKWCYHALALMPEYLDPILSLGHIYSSTRQLDKARTYYHEYLKRQQAFDEHGVTEDVIILHLRSRHNAYYGLGLIAQMEEKYEEAVQWYEKCVGEREDYLDVQYRLGLMHYRLDHLDAALYCWERQAEINPNDGKCAVFLGEVLHRLGHPNDAVMHLRRALELGPQHAIAYYRLAVIEFEQNNFTMAREFIDTFLRIDPAFADGYRLRGDIAYAEENFTEAAEDYLRFLREQPDDSSVLTNLGNCHFRREKFAEAEESYRRAAALDPSHGEALRNWGLSLARLDRVDDACAALERYLADHPDDVEATGFLADIYCQVDDLPSAIRCYEAVVAADATRPEIWTRLGDCYSNQGYFDAALVGYQKALELNPEHQLTLDRLRTLREHFVKQKELNETRAVADGSLTIPE